MTDKYIDSDETRHYGPHASRNIRSRLIGRIAEFDAALHYVADGIDAATDAVESAVDAARAKDAEQHQNVQSKAPLLKDAHGLLSRFSNHLDGQDPNTVNRKLYFTQNGTASGVGRGAQSVLLAITTISLKLGDPQCPVRDAAHWHGQFDAMMKALGPAVASANDTRGDRRTLTPEVEAARQAWLNGYIAAKCLVECVLRHLGRVEHMSVYFYDMRLAASAKLTAPPPDEPASPDEEP
jgi:hypothetical protein